MRLSDGYRVRLRLTHKLLFFHQVIGLFIVKMVKFDTINVVLCVDIRVVVLWSSYKWIFSQIKSVLLFQVSAVAQSIDLSKINIYRVPFLKAAFKEKNNLFFVILKFQAGKSNYCRHIIFHKYHTLIVLVLWFSWQWNLPDSKSAKKLWTPHILFDILKNMQGIDVILRIWRTNECISI